MSEVRVVVDGGYWRMKSPGSKWGCLLVPRDRGWTFNGNIERPTFSPSVKETATFHANGHDYPYCNHFIITDGVVNYCQDCTHESAGKSYELPVFTEAELAAIAADAASET